MGWEWGRLRAVGGALGMWWGWMGRANASAIFAGAPRPASDSLNSHDDVERRPTTSPSPNMQPLPVAMVLALADSRTPNQRASVKHPQCLQDSCQKQFDHVAADRVAKANSHVFLRRA